ncbi:hypothetical protein ACSW9O_15945 (plasmid) [Clostridium perfringens]|nr:hypothetical protein [Clostridium perfringens]
MSIFFTKNLDKEEDLRILNEAYENVSKANIDSFKNIDKMKELNSEAMELSKNIQNALPINSELIKNSDIAKNRNDLLSATNKVADDKNNQLNKSLEETKNFIKNLDSSQNIPQIRSDLDKLQNGLKSNQSLSYEGSSVVANDTLEGRTEGMRIIGKTLYNIQRKQVYSLGTNLSSDCYTSQQNTNSIDVTLNKIEEGKYYFINIGDVEFNLLKPNTKYTVMCEDVTDGLSIQIMCTGYNNQLSDVGTFKDNKTTITTNDLSVGDRGQILYIMFPYNKLGTYKVQNLMLVEGEIDCIGNYFEGIKSMSETEYNYLDESQISLGYIGGDNGITYTIPTHDDGTRTAIVPCEPNTTYTITKEFVTDRFVVGTTAARPISGSSVKKISQVTDKNITITTPPDAKYLLAYLTMDVKNKPYGKVNINKSDFPVEWSTPGKCQISISSHGKNILDPSLKEVNIYYGYANGLKISQNGTTSYSGIVEPNQDYVVSNNKGQVSNFTFWDKDNNFINGIAVTMEFTTPYNARTLKCACDNDALVQIEKGNISTPYQPYVSDKKNILIPAPLRGFNGIKDIMSEDNGQVEILRQLEQYNFNGNETITKENTLANITRFYIDIPVNNVVNTRNLICNNFNSNGTWWDRDEIGMYWDTTIKGRLWFHIPKTQFSDVESFGNFLKTNQTIIIYQLATPTIEIVECVDIDLDTYQNKTYFNILNSLPGTLDFKVPSNIGSALQSDSRKINEINDFLNNTVIPLIIKNSSDIALLLTNNKNKLKNRGGI